MLMRENTTKDTRPALLQACRNPCIGEYVATANKDHRRIKRRVRPMLGFKSCKSAVATLSGIEMIHMLRKRQLQDTASLSIAERLENLAGAS